MTPPPEPEDDRDGRWDEEPEEGLDFEPPWDRSLYPHPEWTVGLVLVAAGITLIFGLLVDPIWLLVGSPFLLVLVLWLWVRFVALPRREREAREKAPPAEDTTRGESAGDEGS